MAKLKDAPKTEKVVQETENVQEAENVQETENAQIVATEETVKETSIKIEKQETAEIPSNVDKILRMYPNYAKLFIDSQGGVYTEESKHLLKTSAILYQNPYFKQ